MQVRTLLFATDFSPTGEAALRLASALAADYRATMRIVHVGEDAPGDGVDHQRPAMIRSANTHTPADHAKLKRVRPTKRGVPYTHHYLHGSPEHEILAFAAEQHVDLIVIGTHGRTGLSRLLMGSVAEAVVRHAPCPVLTVKATAATESVFAPVQASPMWPRAMPQSG